MTKTARALTVLALTGAVLASAATAHAAPTPDDVPEKGPKLIDRLRSEDTKQLAKSAVGTIPGILGQTAKYSLAPALLGVLLGPPGIVAGSPVGGSYGFAKGSISGIKKV
ncbi:hypothetical protein EKH77_27010 [Streptomyces luteoverticillatus]|uniref:Uncharacterized protein n=1 Tax=Streptomyces luteoverticillatus TaxID=66425 RepID=A0A3Q9G341_STRLT|nr:hypothetical protein [Streptomyces luteoverticillatus]AZQ74375.1 hypothetical protein EKH77_27010 [Streptomyces luteoverticillatus]